MRILIIEDELPAANNLKRMLMKRLPNAELFGPLVSISAAAAWLSKESEPDLIFSDISLTDGSSFEIFAQTQTKAPIIFCTAYDEYALKAFKLNSLDYLLKPLDPDDLDRALNKYDQRQPSGAAAPDYKNLLAQLLEPKSSNLIKRFVIKLGAKLLVVKLEEVHFFWSVGKDTFLQTQEGRSYPVDFSLDNLQKQIPPTEYFRINRNYLISLEAISEVRSYSSSRLKLILHHCDDQDILVSRDKTKDFKLWLSGEQ